MLGRRAVGAVAAGFRCGGGSAAPRCVWAVIRSGGLVTDGPVRAEPRALKLAGTRLNRSRAACSELSGEVKSRVSLMPIWMPVDSMECKLMLAMSFDCVDRETLDALNLVSNLWIKHLFHINETFIPCE